MTRAEERAESKRAPRARVDAPAGVRDAAGHPEWGSDVVVDMLRRLGIEYAALLPGSTFRGIHDSLVNYTANVGPEIVLVNHEMLAVTVARGYARVTGKPMAVFVHDFVGLLNMTMTIYDAWCDRVPVVILGGTGPLDATHRRPWIDWLHTANVQGNAVRDFVKWDDQPGSVAAIPESLMRAYRLAVTEPAGPVYVCFDVELQEERLTGDVRLPDVARYAAPAPPEPDRDALREAARWLVGAEHPLIYADRVGRHEDSVQALVALAELVAAPVIDLGARHNFPTPHDLDFDSAQKALLAEADVVLGLDCIDLDGAMRGRGARKAGDPGERARVAAISMNDFAVRSLTADHQALPAVDLPMLGETRTALPHLLEECRSLVDAGARTRIDARRRSLADAQRTLRERQRAYIAEQWDHAQITEARLASEVWAAIKDEDFVLTYGRHRRMAPGVFHIDGPGRYLGHGGGGAVGAAPGTAIGSALALKGSGKLPVAIIGDGEMLSGIQILWTAAHYQIPSLVVLNNNRAYYNDLDHQIRIAKTRSRPAENAWIGQRMDRPDVDFAGIARTFGWHADGPVKTAAELPDALRRAVAAVKRGEPALVDVWTKDRGEG